MDGYGDYVSKGIRDLGETPSEVFLCQMNAASSTSVYPFSLSTSIRSFTNESGYIEESPLSDILSQGLE